MFLSATNAKVGLDTVSGDQLFTQKITGLAALSWIKNNHTYKFGTDLNFVGLPIRQYGGTGGGNFTFNADQTGLGRIQNLGGGFVGFPYASFLLGLVSSATVSPPTGVHAGRPIFALYA